MEIIQYQNLSKEELINEIILWQNKFHLLEDSYEKYFNEQTQSEKLFQDIIDKNPISIQILDMEGRTIQINSAFKNIFGVAPPLNYSVFTDDQLIKQGFGELFERVKSGNTVYFPDSYFNAHDVDPSFPDVSLWIKTTGFTLNASRGSAHKIVLMHENITARKHAEDALIESEEKFRKIFENIQDVIYQTDLNGIITDINPGIENVSGYRREELIGKQVTEVYWNPDVRKEMVDKIMLNGKIKDYELSLRTKDGKRIITTASSQIVYDSRGNPVGIEGVLHDVTERKQAEELLQQSEELYRNLVEVMPDGVYKSTEDGKFIDINPAMVNILGYSSKEELMAVDIGTHLYFSPEDRESLVLNEDNAEIEVYRLKKKDGSEIWVEDHGRLNLDKTTNILYHEGIIRDITERRRAEEALRKSESIQNKMVSNIGDVIVIIDQNGIIRYKSPNITKLFGWKPEDLVGKSIWNTIHPDDLGSAGDFVSATVNLQNSTGTTEMRYKRRDGKYVWIEMTLVNLLSDPDINGLLGNYHDITERRIVEDTLLSQKKALADILEGTNTGTWDWNIQTGALVVNERWANIIGFTLEELAPFDYNSWINRVHPEDFVKISIIVNQHFNGELDYYDAIFRLKHKNESWVWINARGKVIEWTNDGKPLRMSGIHLDITERKQAEIRLVENEQMLQTVSDNFPGIVFWKDIQLNYLGCNHANAIGAGFNNSSEMIGKNDFDMPWSATEAEKYRSDDREVIESGISKMHIIEMIHQANGQVRWLDTSKVPLRDSNGQIIGILGVSSDITERKQAEMELLSAKELAESNSANVTAIIEGTTGSIWAFNREYKILYINQVFQEEFYKTFGVLLKPGVSLIEALPEPLRAFWSPRYDRVLNNEQFTVEDAIDTENGIVYIQVSFNPIVKRGQVIGGSCFGNNITDKKLAEIELIKAKEKAEESDRLKSAFLANMSHEIRTPMNGIMGFAELLKRPELTGQQQQYYIQIIQKSGARMLNIINDIVDISKIEAGQMKVQIEESNLNEQIEYIFTFFKPEVEAKGIKFSYNNFLPTSKAFVKTDREKLYAILTNLVKNGIKYTEKGSIEFGYRVQDSESIIEFFVKDTGMGIPKDRQEAIFERFIQADIVDKMARQGAGLGLAITKAYLEMLDGKIWVESEPGIGSTFYFTLPYITDSQKNIEFENSDSKKAENSEFNSCGLDLKLLIAEDDETSEMLLSIFVENYCKEILRVRTGLEAIEVCQNNPDIDLILMDIQMPVMGGYEAIQQIRQFNKNVIIIAQTAYGLSGDRERAIEAGCNDYISKPIDGDLLKELIQKYFKK